MKRTRMILIIVIALALISLLPVIAQDETATVEYVFNGTELQRLENGMVIQSWTMPNTLETYQLAAILQFQAQSADPANRYAFDNDRMYLLRADQIVGLWVLRGGRWIEPALIVNYEYDGFTVRRFVNDRLQQTWRPAPGDYQWVASMQAQANKLVAAHVNEEMHQLATEHLPALLAENFTLHATPTSQVTDRPWYSTEFAESLASALAVNSNDPVVMTMENLVVIRQPTINQIMPDGLNIPNFANESPVDQYNVFHLEEGKVTDIWLDIDLATFTQPAN